MKNITRCQDKSLWEVFSTLTQLAPPLLEMSTFQKSVSGLSPPLFEYQR